MRTQEQINNLKKVFIGMYGPIVFFWSDADIDFMADRIQEAAIKHSEWTWEIKIRTKDDLAKDWNQIQKEPKSPKCTFYLIAKKIRELILKYPKIISILLVAKEDQDLVFEFK